MSSPTRRLRRVRSESAYDYAGGTNAEHNDEIALVDFYVIIDQLVQGRSFQQSPVYASSWQIVRTGWMIFATYGALEQVVDCQLVIALVVLEESFH